MDRGIYLDTLLLATCYLLLATYYLLLIAYYLLLTTYYLLLITCHGRGIYLDICLWVNESASLLCIGVGQERIKRRWSDRGVCRVPSGVWSGAGARGEGWGWGVGGCGGVGGRVVGMDALCWYSWIVT